MLAPVYQAIGAGAAGSAHRNGVWFGYGFTESTQSTPVRFRPPRLNTEAERGPRRTTEARGWIANRIRRQAVSEED
jgi:hypothetical protein